MDDIKHSAYCPTCGQPNAVRHSPEWLLTRFNGILANVLALLIECRRQRRPATKRELVEAAYQNRVGGPPVTAMINIATTIHRDRPRLLEMGWDILGPHKTGTGYVLVPMEPEQPDY